MPMYLYERYMYNFTLQGRRGSAMYVMHIYTILYNPLKIMFSYFGEFKTSLIYRIILCQGEGRNTFICDTVDHNT